MVLVMEDFSVHTEIALTIIDLFQLLYSPLLNLVFYSADAAGLNEKTPYHCYREITLWTILDCPSF